MLCNICICIHKTCIYGTLHLSTILSRKTSGPTQRLLDPTLMRFVFGAAMAWYKPYASRSFKHSMPVYAIGWTLEPSFLQVAMSSPSATWLKIQSFTTCFWKSLWNPATQVASTPAIVSQSSRDAVSQRDEAGQFLIIYGLCMLSVTCKLFGKRFSNKHYPACVIV
jgi:hypothetical protein